MSADLSNIRNFCIIAHIDHGKSTLADRLLEFTGTIEKREMREQFLDQMDIERERGITIKLQPVRMLWRSKKDNLEYILNLIDTPGHVDFTYEVSRSLLAVEGAVLLVDATQGIQAQTLSNLYLAMEQNLAIIPVINKVDLPNAEVDGAVQQVVDLLGVSKEEIILASAKKGIGIEEILNAVVLKVPPPRGEANKPFRALIFDSHFDEYKGVIAYVRVVDGHVRRGDRIKMLASGKMSEALEIGFLKPPRLMSSPVLSVGEIGYVATGLKEVGNCRVGDTITVVNSEDEEVRIAPLPGYKEIKPMVFAGVFCQKGDDFQKLREALQKLKLNDASLFFEPEKSSALGLGFRCGFLGLLHLEIIQERLKREYGLDLALTVPSVAYHVYLKNGEKLTVRSPQELPDSSQINYVEEPWMKVDIVTPENYIGSIMQMVIEKKGRYVSTEYLSGLKSSKDFHKQVILHYEVPLTSLLVDFYDKLKSVSSGFATLAYDFLEYRKTEVVKLDILVAGDEVGALSSIVYKDSRFFVARKIVEKLKASIPRQMFEIKIQAAVGGDIVASERLSAFRKDVTAKLYGGDVTRRMKLLEKQKKGKKKMKSTGRVAIPTKAFLEVLKR